MKKKIIIWSHLEEGYTGKITEIMEFLKHIHPPRIFEGEF